MNKKYTINISFYEYLSWNNEIVKFKKPVHLQHHTNNKREARQIASKMGNIAYVDIVDNSIKNDCPIIHSNYG